MHDCYHVCMLAGKHYFSPAGWVAVRMASFHVCNPECLLVGMNDGLNASGLSCMFTGNHAIMLSSLYVAMLACLPSIMLAGKTTGLNA
ncbi:MAG: hypothetical protein HUU22_02090 [Phycisphaerae bacterium]|nr:hypothetical protein [Phycisphaerae bacterium]NUQ44805.1 hypothetical protein [Phycisphaerae bacterium]